jgi:hypothetical protein
MRRQLSILLGTLAAPGAFAHEIEGAGGLLQSIHAASSVHHWNGILLLAAVAVLVYLYRRRTSRTE